MKINVIIGAGQLGSRHLQGLLRLTMKQKIFVLDPSEVSLEVSKTRANEIPSEHEIIFSKDWEVLPQKLDLVIIATGANVRAMLVEKLLPKYKVKYLVLEKVLFQDLKSYDRIGNLLKQTNTATWVNHPRRMAEHYNAIKAIVAKSGEKIVFNAVGSNWGLACNALHLIDLCAFIGNSSVDQLDLDWIENIVHESKRANNIEFTGTLKGTLENQSNFSISALDGEIGDISISIFTNSHRWIIQEGHAQKIIYLAKESNFNEVITSFTAEFQSTLTTRIATDLFKTGNSNLPTYRQACESHIPFIKAALKKYTEITEIETTICPIT
ncbi:Gfo/Idh/MocA family oxidoreductase [Polaribacter sp.]|uniref:Gfo/Idh/MocA family oxidoreductase n=1 Tax=Polaribacter sp. TaxID=1920175 RepID=UPI0040489555